MFFCIIPYPLWIANPSLFSCFFFRNKKTKRILISLQLVIQTSLVEKEGDSERPLAIVETHTDSGKGRKRFLDTTFEEVTTHGNERKISHSINCHIHMYLFPNLPVINLGQLICSLAVLQTKTTTRFFFDVLHRQLSNCRRSIYGTIHFWLYSIRVDLGRRRDIL